MKPRLTSYITQAKNKAFLLLALVAIIAFIIAKIRHTETLLNYILLAIIFLLVIFISKGTYTAVEEALQQQGKSTAEPEKRFRALLENNDGIIALIDEHLNTIYRNVSAARITGWAHGEKEEKAALEFVHPGDQPILSSTIAEAKENPGKPLPVAMRVKHKNGDYIWLQGIVTNRLNDAAINGIIINLHDVSAQKHAEQKLIKVNRLYFFISQVNQMIVRVKDEEALFSEACRIAVEMGKFRMAWIGLTHKQTRQLVPVAHAGEEKEYLSRISISSNPATPEGNGPTGKAIREGRYIFCNDIEQSPNMAPWKEAALGRNYHSSMSLPIKMNGGVIGAFTVYADTKNFFDAEEIALLEEATGDISFAMEVFEKERLRQQAEVELQKSEQRYQTLTETSPVGIFHTDATGYTTYVNPAWCRIAGVKQEDALGNGWLNAVHVADRASLTSSWEKATDGQELSLSEYRFVRPDGSISWVLGQAVPQKDTGNNVIGYIGTTTDITERKIAEERLLKTQEIGKLGYWQLDLKTGMVWASRQAMRIYGFGNTEGELHRDKIAACIVDRDILTAAFDKLINYNQDFEVEIRILPADKGPMKYVSSTGEVERNQEGEPVRLVGILQDITERKKAAQEIENIYREKETVLNRINDAVISVDTEWRYTFINDAALATHSFGRAQTLGKVLWDIHPEMKGTIFWDKYHEAMATGKVVELDTFYAPMNIWFTVRVYPSHDGLSIFYRDVTEKVITQNALIKEKNLSDSIINTMPGVFYLYTKEGKFLRWNKNFEKVTGYNAEEIGRMHPLDFFDTEEKAVVGKKIDNAFSLGEDSVQADFLLKTKEKVPYYFTGKAIGYEGLDCLAGVGIDFSELTKAQQQIKETAAQLRHLTAHLQSIREEERKRIGREIHDDLGQQLTAIKMDIAWIDKKIPEENPLLKTKLKNVIGLLDESNLSIRRILSELRPVILDHRGLPEAIEWLGRKLTENKEIQVQFSSQEIDIELPEPVATCIFRVYQEALTNIIRYAGPCTVHTSLEMADRRVRFSIADNGRGFDSATVESNKSFGILGMKERVLSLGGVFELNAVPGAGTSIIIELPVKIEETF